jgi:hypothetical protein
MGSTQRKMQCFGVLLAGSIVLTTTVLYVLSDSDSGSPPPSTHIRPHAYQSDWQQLGHLLREGPVQRQAYQVHWQRPGPLEPGPLQSEGIEWAERINEQMMRQRYRDQRKCLEELRWPLVPSSALFPDGR